MDAAVVGRRSERQRRCGGHCDQHDDECGDPAHVSLLSGDVLAPGTVVGAANGGLTARQSLANELKSAVKCVLQRSIAICTEARNTAMNYLQKIPDYFSPSAWKSGE